MAKQLFLAYLKGHRFIVEAEVIEVAGAKVVKGMEVQIPMDLPDGVVDSIKDENMEYYIPFPDEILDNCYTAPHAAAPTLRDHFRSEVIDRNLSIGGHLDETS